MENEFDFKQSFEDAIKTLIRSFSVVDGTIAAINGDNTCDVVVGNQTFYSAPICVLIGSQASIYPIPVEGSNCLICFRDGNFSNPQIIGIDKVDKWLINCNLVEFNGGNNGGMPVTPNVVERLNLIEIQLNAILNILKAIAIPSTPFDFAPLFATLNDLSETQASNIESTVITQ